MKILGRYSLFVGLALILSLLAGCQKKVNSGVCKNDEDCSVDAEGNYLGGICYMGKCEECAADTDCSDLKQCVSNRCLSSCQASSDCGSNERCQNNYCVAVGQDTTDGSFAGAQGGCQGLEKIHFDFDRFDIKPEDKEHVAKLAQCLEQNPQFTVVIEGHADDRGTPTYNLALGDKRATSVKNYLKTAFGIASHRVKTVSYGAEKPEVTNEKNEYAWQQNRRAVFNVEIN